MSKTAIYTFFLIFWLGMGTPAPVCGQDNPFDLVPRIEQEAAKASVTPDSQAAGNPFDLVQEAPAIPDSQAAGNPFNLVQEAPDARQNHVAPAPAKPSPARPGAPNRYQRLKLFVIFGILLLLAVFLTFMRSLFRKSFRAFLNDTVMNQLYRDQQGRGIFPFLLLYSMFFINAGVFIFFIIKYYQLPQSMSDWSLLLFCILGVAGLLLLKHILLGYLSYTFPIEKEVSRYHFMIIIFSIVISLFLVPVNTLMAYTSESLRSGVLYISLGVIAIIYLFRYLRSLLVANKFFQFHKFHFLLYICTVEIAPVLFLFKLISMQL